MLIMLLTFKETCVLEELLRPNVYDAVLLGRFLTFSSRRRFADIGLDSGRLDFFSRSIRMLDCCTNETCKYKVNVV